MGRFDDRDRQIELRKPKVMIRLILSAIGINSLFILALYFEMVKTDLNEILILITFFVIGWGFYLLQKEINKYQKIKNG